jgi:hypothetical protein
MYGRGEFLEPAERCEVLEDECAMKQKDNESKMKERTRPKRKDEDHPFLTPKSNEEERS